MPLHSASLRCRKITDTKIQRRCREGDALMLTTPSDGRPFARWLQALFAGFAVIGMIALSDCVRFGHIRTILGFAVPTVRRAVINLAALIDPHLASAAPGGSSHGLGVGCLRRSSDGGCGSRYCGRSRRLR